MEMALSFNDVQFDIVDHNNEIWLRSYQIGSALGYGMREGQIDLPLATDAIRRLYNRHADEFTPSMTSLIKLPTSGGEQEVRIFSLRGCHLLAMLARTPVAKEFRKWVLDVLDSLAKKEIPGTESDSPIPPSDQNIIQALVAAIADRYPELERKRVFMQVWMRFRNHFRIASYKQLPQCKMAEAVTWLANLKVNEPRQGKLASGKKSESFAIDPEMSKLLQEMLTALTDMQKEADYRVGIIQGYLQNSVINHRSSEEARRMFSTLKHIRNMAAEGLYMAQNALAVAWNLGRGVIFR